MAFSFATFCFLSRIASFAVRTASGPQKYFWCTTRDLGRSFLPQYSHSTIARLITLRHSPSTTGYVVRTTSTPSSVSFDIVFRSL